MEKSAYQEQADLCLDSVASWLDGFDPDDVDYQTSDGVVTISFPDGTRYVLNRQSAASQMWFAAGARAWHYDWDETRRAWVDDRDGHPLTERITAVVAEKLGRNIAKLE